MSIIRGVIILILLIALAVSFVYYIIYSRYINAKIASGERTGKGMLGIPNALRVVFVVALLAYAIFVSYVLNRSSNQTIEENHNSFSVISLSDYSYRSYSGTLTDNDASYAKSFSRESNEGYMKTVSQDGDFVFTTFTRTGQQDVFHPDFFCFVDYVGEKSGDLSLYEYYEFVYSQSEETGGGMGSGGADIEDGFLVIGNANAEDAFKINLSILDSEGEAAFTEAEQKAYEEDKGDFPSQADFAKSSASAVIRVK